MSHERGTGDELDTHEDEAQDAAPHFVSEGAEDEEPVKYRPDARAWLTLGAALAIIAGLLVVIYQLLPGDPGQESVEANFLRDMMTHHGQAVDMGLAISDRTDDERLYYLATDIALTQQTEIGVMTGWLDAWGLEQTSEDLPMTWMGHGTTGRMPGMASPEELEQLETLPVEEAEVHFLQLMTIHHLAGVDMAQALVDRSDERLTSDIADRMIFNQRMEIDVMNAMLEERGEDPITELPPEHQHAGH